MDDSYLGFNFIHHCGNVLPKQSFILQDMVALFTLPGLSTNENLKTHNDKENNPKEMR